MNEEWGFFYLEESFCAQVERFSKPVTNRKDQDLFKVKAADIFFWLRLLK